MRKIILFIASSLDGYIARESGEIDWLFTDQDYGYKEFYAQVDTLIMGNKTYQQVLSFDEYPYKDKEIFVFSKTQSGTTYNQAKFVNSDWVNFIKTLRQSHGRNIWLVGGAQLIHFFLQQSLINELILYIHPIILGSGIPLIVNDSSLETKLDLQNVKTFKTGLVQIFYKFNQNNILHFIHNNVALHCPPYEIITSPVS